MRLHRFIGNFDLAQEVLTIEEPEILHQIRKVLRFKTGDKFILADGNLNEAKAEILPHPDPLLIKERVPKAGEVLRVKILERSKNENEPANKIVLYLAILKRENFELAIQKAVEVGISEIVPIITERTIKTGLNMDRLRKIIKEAAEQSGRGIVPFLHEPISFEKAVEQTGANNKNVIFHTSEALYIPEGLGSSTERARGIFQQENIRARGGMQGEAFNLFIGPEGGFSEKEIELAKNKNFEIASLGKLTLRAETAAIVASYLFSK